MDMVENDHITIDYVKKKEKRKLIFLSLVYVASILFEQVRVYTSKNVNEELDAARSEYLQASIGFRNDKKVLLPKILEWYAREASISSSALLEWLSHHIDEKEKDILLKCIRSRPNKNASHCIEWQPYNFNFRYMFHPKAQRIAPCWLTI
mgnify:CR=1 FL=1